MEITDEMIFDAIEIFFHTKSGTHFGNMKSALEHVLTNTHHYVEIKTKKNTAIELKE